MLKSPFLILVFAAAIAAFTFGHAGAAQLLSVAEAQKQAVAGQITLIDIRSREEWQETGVSPQAHLNSMHEKGFLERLKKLSADNKDTPIALICASGVRSKWLAGELEKRGFTNIYDVGEGMMGSGYGPGWIKSGLKIRPAQK